MMKTKIEKNIENTGTGAGRLLEIATENLSPLERRLYRAHLRCVRIKKEIAARDAARAAEVEAGRLARLNQSAESIAEIKARRESSKIRRASVRRAIAAHAAGLVPKAGAARAGRGGWDGAGRVEVALWRGAARFADSLAKYRGAYVVGRDGRAGLREIVFHEVPFLVDAAARVSLPEFLNLVRFAREKIREERKRYFNALREARRREALREMQENEMSMDEWEERDEFSGGAVCPWSVEQCAAADELGLELPRLINSDPRKLASGGAGKRPEIAAEIAENAAGIVALCMRKSAAAAIAAGAGKGAFQRKQSARNWEMIGQAVEIVTSGGILPPEIRAGLSSGELGGIGKAWERNIEKLRAELGGKLDPYATQRGAVPDFSDNPPAVSLGNLGAALVAAGV